MKMGDLVKSESKFIKGDDLARYGRDGVEVIIESFKYENVAADNQPDEIKAVLFFVGKVKGLVLNKTNMDNLYQATHTGAMSDTEECHGCRIRLWRDPDVRNPKGDLVGGVRIIPESMPDQLQRKFEEAGKPMSRDESLQAEAEADAQAHTAQPELPEFDDDIPF